MSKAATKPDRRQENLVRLLWYFDVQFMAQERQKSNYHQRTILLHPPLPRGSGYRQGLFYKIGQKQRRRGDAMAAAVKCVTAAAIEPSLSPSLCSFLSVFPRLMLAVSAAAVPPPRLHSRQKRKKRKREAIKTQKNGSHLHTYLFSILHILKTYQSLFFV